MTTWLNVKGGVVLIYSASPMLSNICSAFTLGLLYVFVELLIFAAFLLHRRPPIPPWGGPDPFPRSISSIDEGPQLRSPELMNKM